MKLFTIYDEIHDPPSPRWKLTWNKPIYPPKLGVCGVWWRRRPHPLGSSGVGGEASRIAAGSGSLGQDDHRLDRPMAPIAAAGFRTIHAWLRPRSAFVQLHHRPQRNWGTSAAYFLAKESPRWRTTTGGPARLASHSHMWVRSPGCAFHHVKFATLRDCGGPRGTLGDAGHDGRTALISWGCVTHSYVNSTHP